MKAQIQQLIANGQTKDALNLLVQMNGDALLLQAQYNNGEKQFNLGLIEFSEWQRIQARVNFAALEMVGKAAAATPVPASTGNTESADKGSNSSPAAPGVFISYNQQDIFPMRAVKDFLEKQGIKVFVDINDLAVGGNIEAFIEKAFKENQVILSIISEHSLKSGWVNQELNTALLLNKFGSKWLPVLLDRKCFDPVFYNNTLDEFDAKLKEMNKTLQATLKKGRDIRPFTDELERLKDLQSDFGKTIQTLKNHLAEDISGNLFEHGMTRVVKAIKNP